MMTSRPDGHGLEHPMVSDYLERLRREATRLPADQAHELYADIADHLQEALGDDPGEEQVRAQLDRVGSPALLVDEAGGEATTTPGEARGLAVAAVVLLVLAELLFFLPTVAVLVWAVGLALLAVPREWTGRQKLRGYLSLGTGLPVVFLLLSVAIVGESSTCSGGTEVGPDGTVAELPTVCTETSAAGPWLGVLVAALTLGYLAWQVLTARQLLRSRGR
jgi:hypothetical protein